MKHNYASYPPLSAIILGCFLFCNTITAQYVTIPDATFVSWLQSNGYGSCLNGNQLDTACSAVQNAFTMSCNSVPIRDLTGIQYFPNLTQLDCSNDSISYIPALPPKLGELTCNMNKLDSLPVLDSLLTIIYCYNNQLVKLPALPAITQLLFCDNNRLTTLPAFGHNLQYFTCTRNMISSLPTLPDTLLTLQCDYNLITSIPPLPHALIRLTCDSNMITSLPALPATLQDLECGFNPLFNLPALPVALKSMDCRADSLSALPALPDSIQGLRCSYNLLTTLPTLPASLLNLDYSYNQVTGIVGLPAGLQSFICSYNQISVLWPLPDSLNWFQCDGNQLTTLPALPKTVAYIQCNNNQLTSLPILPDSVAVLYCYNNPNLSCLPELKEVNEIDFTGTAISCLPDYGINYYSNPPFSTVPLCGIYNNTGCQPFWAISGQCYYDQNNDCIFDSLDVGTNYIKTQLYSGGNLIQQAFTTGEGFYSFDSVAYGNYTVQVDTSNLPFAVSCPSSGNYSVAITSLDSISFANNFAFKCRTQGFDVGVQSILNNYVVPRPDAIITLNTIAGDMSEIYGANCAAGTSGQVQMVYTGQVSYAGPAGGAITPTTVSGDTITWAIADFGQVNDFSAFNLLFKVDSLAVPGTSICFNVSVTPVAGDYNPGNNNSSYCLAVVNALDPNEKEASPIDTISGTNPWLTYTIRFQNTGSAAAVNVRVTDTLDSHLDVSSFQLLASSAKNLTQIIGNAVVFNFPNINLPDSATSDSASRGYVQFKVRLGYSLPVGTEIRNTGYIYFDLNPAVVTNTTVNTLTSPTGIIAVSNTLSMQLYPNPTKNYVIVETDESAIGGTLQITDITGRAVYNSIINNSAFRIPTSALTGGVYLVKVNDLNGRSGVRKLVVE